MLNKGALVENVNEMNVIINNKINSSENNLNYEEILKIAENCKEIENYNEAIKNYKQLLNLAEEKEIFEEISYEIADTYYKWGNTLFSNGAYLSALSKFEYSLNYNIDNNYKNEIHEKKGDIYKKTDKLVLAYEEYNMCKYSEWDKIRIICKKEILNKKGSYIGILYVGFMTLVITLSVLIKNAKKFFRNYKLS